MNVIAIVGLESIKDANGNVKYHADTFLNNIRTWHRDNPKAALKTLDGRDYMNGDNPIKALWADMASAYGDKGIDQIIYSGHSDSEKLYWISKSRHDLSDDVKFISDNDWPFIFNKDACIRIAGCQAGGQRGVKWPKCVAQTIANKSKIIVWAFTSRSSQQQRNGGYYQTPDIGGYVEFIPSH